MGPPGVRPYNLSYTSTPGQLSTVSRDSLVPSTPTATWTMMYDVPRSGANAPWQMGAGSSGVGAWNQAVVPFKATAISPPDQPVSATPGGLQKTTVYYMDPLGQTVNTVSPGTASGGSVTPRTTATDYNKYGNVTRSLTAANLAVARASTDPATTADLRSTQTVYSGDKYQKILDVKGPEHEVKLPGVVATVRARDHSWSVAASDFDEGVPAPSVPGQPQKGTTNDPDYPYNVPTTVRTGAYVTQSGLAISGTDQQVRISKTEMQWTTRMPVKTIKDVGGLNITRTFVRDVDGNETQRRQPSAPTDPSAPTTTTTTYYHTSGTDPDCNTRAEWAGLPCKVKQGGQPITAGLPKLPEKRYSYDLWRRPVTTSETVIDSGGSAQTRTTTRTFSPTNDRVTRDHVDSTVGSPLADTTQTYNANGDNTSTQFDATPARTITRSYDGLGRLSTYTDATGTTTTTEYDVVGRPSKVIQVKPAPNAVTVVKTLTYDSVTGDLTTVNDDGAGTITASYDADGRAVAVLYPGGISKGILYSAAGAVQNVNYTRTTACSSNCTMYTDSVSRDASGQVVDDVSTLGTRSFGYDGAGRLTSATDLPAGGVCTTRTYTLDADSNRTKKVINASATATCPAPGGTTGTVVDTALDNADRLKTVTGYGQQAAAPTYDAFGRITALPSQANGGGTALSFGYFANDLAKSVVKGAATVTNALDPLGRVYTRTTTTAGQTSATVETYSYSDDSDGPAFISSTDAPTWTRTVGDPSGGLALQVSSAGAKNLQFSNVRGDVVAEAATTATALTTNFATDEFGVATAAQMTKRKFGFIGSALRESLSDGSVVSMGARTYLPQLGRFAQTDPILGGSDNPYDYCNQDPVNLTDVDGTAPVPGGGIMLKTAIKLARQTKHGRKTAAAGRAAERVVSLRRGVPKNTQTVPSPSGAANYRIPDFLWTDKSGNNWLTEVKNVGKLRDSKQLKDFEAYAKDPNNNSPWLELVISRDTKVGPITEKRLLGRGWTITRAKSW